MIIVVGDLGGFFGGGIVATVYRVPINVVVDCRDVHIT